MDKKTYDARYALYHAAIEEYLNGLFTADVPYKTLFESMRYRADLGMGPHLRHGLEKGAAFWLRAGADPQLFSDPR